MTKNLDVKYNCLIVRWLTPTSIVSCDINKSNVKVPPSKIIIGGVDSIPVSEEVLLD